MNYRFKKFIQRFIAAIAAIIFISSDFLIPAATQAFVPAAAPGLLPIIGDVILFGTAAELATIAAPIVVGGFVIGAAYYYWSQEQSEQAQIKAEEKYCSANPGEQLCDVPPPFTGGQLPVPYHYKFHETVHYRRSGYPDKLVTHHYRSWQPAPGTIRSLAKTYPTGYWGGGYPPDGYDVTWISLNGGGGNNQTRGVVYEYSTGDPISWDEHMYIYSNNNAEKGWISDLVCADGLPDNGGNLPSSSSLDWKDWPQDKRQAATNLLKDDDLIPILKTGNTGTLATGQTFPNGIHIFPNDGQPSTFLPGPITVSDHLSQPTPSPSPEPSQSPEPIPLPSPSPEPTPPPPPPSPEPEPETDGAGAREGGGYTITETKFDYFFGRVRSTPKNEAKSKNIAKNLNKLGINEAAGGRSRLHEIFLEGLNAPEVFRVDNQYGTTIIRKVEISNVKIRGGIEISYLYRNGDLSSTPEVTTIIVKIYN